MLQPVASWWCKGARLRKECGLKMQDDVTDGAQWLIQQGIADPKRLAATSPAQHTDRVKTPLFSAQGARDPRVNKAESDQVVKALGERRVQVEYMVKDDEGHGFQNGENQFAFYAAMEAFFGRYLKP